MSPEVTIPSKCPYSSKTSAMCTVDERIARSTCSASERSITTGAWRIMSAHIERLAVGEKLDEVLEDQHADDVVGPPSCTGSRERCVPRTILRISSVARTGR